ncbi:MAG: beta-propeller domain-containing protein [Clostridiales Family XIII bacterium]|jgi:uncharacterized secreted protein with C-terminal beta-propeller domain|nr:beta-propeller domain-containing protein [Clostridiales Family XIII bacterium]
MSKINDERLAKTGYFKDMNEDMPSAAQIISDAEKKNEERKAAKAGVEKRHGFKRYEIVSMLSVAACVLLVLAVTLGPLSGVLSGIRLDGSSKSGADSSVDSDGGGAEYNITAGSGDSEQSESSDLGGADENLGSPDIAAISGKLGVSIKKVETADNDYSNLYKAVEDNAGYPVMVDDVPQITQLAPPGAPPSEHATPQNPTPSIPEATPPVPEDKAAPVPDSADTSDESGVDDREFSDTNIQVEGVQEADIVKTDGTYIYAAGAGYIHIIRAGGGHPEVLSKIERSYYDEYSYPEMYLTESRLILIRERAGVTGHPSDLSRSMENYGYICYPGETDRTDTSAEIYDITDKKNPKPIEVLTQSGRYTDSRMIGDQLYLLSSYDEFIEDEIIKAEPQTYVPGFVQGNIQKCARAGDITILPDIESSTYTVISSIDSKSANYTDHESVFGGTPIVYSSRDNMYLATPVFSSDERTKGDYKIESSGENTQLTRISLAGGKIKTEAQAEIPGRVDDQFSVDEYDGVLRIVTTEEVSATVRTASAETYYYDEDAAEDTEISGEMASLEELNSYKFTSLYTLDMKLKELGRIGDLAPDEEVFSARFMGDVGYFVTFRQTDPLFSVDLSNPKKPKILGELKIPGFSEYLQSWNKDLLFGFGKDADEDTGEVGSLKLKMFDVSDPSDVNVKDSLLLSDIFDSEASYNHKAILADPGKGIIAFPTYEGKYIICSYSEKSGFKRIVDIDMSGDIDMSEDTEDDDWDDDWDEWWYDSIRGLFIGNVFYVVSNEGIFTYNMNNGFKNIEHMVY